MYDPRRFLTQEPAAVVTVVQALVAALIASDVISVSDVALASWSTAVLGLLNLGYVRQLTVTKAGLDELERPPG